MKRIWLIAVIVFTACDDPFLPDASRLYTSLATGGEHTCAVATDGSAYCWGRGLDGELGIGVKENRATPARVLGDISFEQIAAGESHTCALATDGAAYCWGWNAFFQRGNPTDPRDAEPVPVTTQRRFTSISAGSHHTCAIGVDSLAYCWGFNRYGQIGDGSTVVGFTPMSVEGGIKFTKITAGAWHTCGLSTTGTVYCWGRNDFGQLGIGSSALQTSVPTTIVSSVRFMDVDAGMTHTCAINITNEAFCWGSNEFGELGNGGSFKPGLPGATVPTRTSSLLPAVVSISAGNAHTCARNEAGTSWCWGRAIFGQLGVGSTVNQSHAQRLIAQPRDRSARDRVEIQQFATGGTYHSCALVDDAVFCWGTGLSGQLGMGSIAFAPYAQRILD